MKTIQPSKRPLKTIYCAIIMAVLSWFIPVIACRKKSVREEISFFPKDFTFSLAIWPAGPAMAFRRVADRLQRISPKNPGLDMKISLKSIDAAWYLFSFQESTCESEANGRLIVKGELPHTCTFIRLMDKVEILLLPRFIAKRAVKQWERVL